MAYTLEQQKENRKKWVKALRSGKYQQATGALCDGMQGYCCLGVAARVLGYSRKEILADQNNMYELVGEGVGLVDSLGLYSDHRSLARQNDMGVSFAEIANIIESEPYGLFVETV